MGVFEKNKHLLYIKMREKSLKNTCQENMLSESKQVSGYYLI